MSAKEDFLVISRFPRFTAEQRTGEHLSHTDIRRRIFRLGALRRAGSDAVAAAVAVGGIDGPDEDVDGLVGS